MAKKGYDVAARFQEVAKRARETGPINAGPKKKHPEHEGHQVVTQEEKDYISRPGADIAHRNKLRKIQTGTSDINLAGPKRK